jgi:heme/copper-type cytochrome/quinol oxidase subunit 2
MMSWFPENIATYGKELDDLFFLIYLITGAAFVLVTVLLVAFLVLYRARPGRKAVYTATATRPSRWCGRSSPP